MSFCILIFYVGSGTLRTLLPCPVPSPLILLTIYASSLFLSTFFFVSFLPHRFLGRPLCNCYSQNLEAFHVDGGFVFPSGSFGRKNLFGFGEALRSEIHLLSLHHEFCRFDRVLFVVSEVIRVGVTLERQMLCIVRICLHDPFRFMWRLQDLDSYNLHDSVPLDDRVQHGAHFRQRRRFEDSTRFVDDEENATT